MDLFDNRYRLIVKKKKYIYISRVDFLRWGVTQLLCLLEGGAGNAPEAPVFSSSKFYLSTQVESDASHLCNCVLRPP